MTQPFAPAAGGYRATALANLGTGQLWAGRFSKPPALEAEALGRQIEQNAVVLFSLP